MTLRSGADHDSGLEFLQGVRSSLTSLREILLESQEIQALLDSITDISDNEIGEWASGGVWNNHVIVGKENEVVFASLFSSCKDTLVELSLHKVALKPVSTNLYYYIHASRSNDGSLKQLQGNMRVLEKKGIKELGGSAGVGVPDAVALERIQQRWASLHEAYSPTKKVHVLLKVCKSIYHSMSANATSGALPVAVSGAEPHECVV